MHLIVSFLILAVLSRSNALRLQLRMGNVKQEQVCILGAGPSGLSTAIMLARRGYKNIKVFDKLDEPMVPDDPSWVDFSKERSYNIGISGRGQRALKALDVMSHVERYSADVIGRMDWSPEAPLDKPREVIYTTKSYTTKVIQRDRLASVLLQELRQNDEYNKAVTVHYNTECNKVDFLKKESTGEPLSLLRFSSKTSVGELVLESSFVVGCDGSGSALRDAMEESSRGKLIVKKFEDKNVRVYRTIPLHFPSGSGPQKSAWNSLLNYSARTKSDINIDALPTKGGPMLGVVLYRPYDTRVTGLKSKEDARQFFDAILPMFSDVVTDDDLARFAAKEDSRLPRFSYTGPTIHYGGTACLVGDAIHTVKPYFGLGVNSAFEDVIALSESLEKHHDDVGKSIKEYSKRRGPEAKAMVQISKRLDGGFLTFVLPLLVDNLFHKKLPLIFSPNTLSSLQNENLTFSFIQLRKRLDRIMQVSVIGAALLGMIKASTFLLRAARRLVLG